MGDGAYYGKVTFSALLYVYLGICSAYQPTICEIEQLSLVCSLSQKLCEKTGVISYFLGFMSVVEMTIMHVYLCLFYGTYMYIHTYRW